MPPQDFVPLYLGLFFSGGGGRRLSSPSPMIWAQRYMSAPSENFPPATPKRIALP